MQSDNLKRIAQKLKLHNLLSPMSFHKVFNAIQCYVILPFIAFPSFMHLADAFISSDLHCISSVDLIQFNLTDLIQAFTGNQTHELGVANTILCLSYRNALYDQEVLPMIWTKTFSKHCLCFTEESKSGLE